MSLPPIPFRVFEEWLPGLNVTRLPDREYSHIRIIKDGDSYYIRLKGNRGDVDISKYALGR